MGYDINFCGDSVFVYGPGGGVDASKYSGFAFVFKSMAREIGFT